MLLLTLINLFTSVFFVIGSFLPTVTELPFGIDSILVQGAGYVHFLGGVFPPLGYLLQAFMYYLGFLLLLKVFRLIPVVRNMFD